MSLLNAPITRFFRQETAAPKAQLLAMAAVSGIANGLLLAVINSVVEMANSDELHIQAFFFYLIALALFIYAKHFALTRATAAVEEAIYNARTRLTDKLRRTELSFIENTPQGAIYNSLTQDANLISQSAVLLINACQGLIAVIFSFIYIAILSPTGFFIILGGLIGGAMLYVLHSRATAEKLRQVAQRETDFFSSLEHLVAGFKEIRINQRKNQAVYEENNAIAADTRELKTAVGNSFVLDLMFAQIVYYLLFAIIIFILPNMTTIDAATIIKITAAVLFIVGPVDMVVSAIPAFARANVAIEGLQNLEKQLDYAAQQAQTIEQYPVNDAPFQSLKMENLHFQYVDPQGQPLFAIGPIDFEIQRGELVFVVGGNGSGKSTFLKLLIGLYYPHQGQIYLNGQPVLRADYLNYREQFSAIFTDFHLFDKIYGVTTTQATVDALLVKMEMAKKTRYVEGRFTVTKLSTGQRKRLAYIASVLEDKSVLIFDEWAADQDPHFRQFFYRTLLPELRDQGKTIIAVTHDDHYFDAADRVLKMDRGLLLPL